MLSILLRHIGTFVHEYWGLGRSKLFQVKQITRNGEGGPFTHSILQVICSTSELDMLSSTFGFTILIHLSIRAPVISILL